MTITSTPSEIAYAGDGVSTVFTIPFAFDTSADLKVTKTDSSGNITTLTSGFTISGGSGSTGSLTLTSALASGYTLTILDDPERIQDADYVSNDAFPAESHEKALDHGVRLSKRLWQLVQRCIRTQDGDPISGDSMTLGSVDNRKGKYLFFNAITGAIEYATAVVGSVLSQSIIGQFLNPQSTAEASANVTPTNYSYQPGDVRRYGAVGNGTTDDSTAFANAALVCGTHPMLIPYTSGGYKIVTPFVLPTNATMQGVGLGRPQLFATVNGTQICSAIAGGPITISNIRFLGTSASTLPLNGFGGFSSQSTGLVAIANCSDVRITDCEFSTFYNCLSANGCTRVWILRNTTYNCIYTGILCGSTTRFEIDFNDIDNNSAQSSAAVAYGVQCTGDQAGSKAAQFNSVSFNRIRNIPSWDAIGTHDIDGLRVIGNDCRNVRHGIDIGFLVNTNVVENIIVSHNYIEGTGTDTYSGVGAEIGAILIAGLDATHRVLGATISGNLIRGFFNVTGMVGAGNGAGCICVAHTDDACVTGNVITGGGAGNTPQSTGIFVTGTVNRLTVSANSIQGQSYPRGGIRLQNVTSDLVSITGNSGFQTTSGNNHILISGSTITGLGVGNNPSNSTTPYVESTSTIGYKAGGATGNFVGTLTGCTTSPTANVTWTVSNGVVLLNIPALTATSNSTSCTITGLPAELQPVALTSADVMASFTDNSAFASGCTASVAPGSGTITFTKGGSTTGFTNVGTKGPGNSTIKYSLN